MTPNPGFTCYRCREPMTPQGGCGCEDSICLVHGDCRLVVPTLDPGSVDLIAADPPYFKVKGEAWDRQWDKPAEFITWLGGIFEQWQRVLAGNGSVYCFASPQMAWAVEGELQKWFRVLTNIRWRKPPFATKAEMFEKDDLRSPFPASETILFAEHHAPWADYIEVARRKVGLSRQDVSQHVVGTRSGACWNWEAGIRLPEPEHWRGLSEILDLPDYETVVRPFNATPDAPYTDVWDFPTVSATRNPGKHPCEKPVAMMEHIIALSSREDSLTCDPFAGGGSTLVAAKQLSQRAIGIEKEAKYCRRAANRLKQEVLFT